MAGVIYLLKLFNSASWLIYLALCILTHTHTHTHTHAQEHDHPSSEVSPLDVDSAAPLQKPRSRRGAVSASVMTEEQATSYVKKVG